MSFPAFDLPVHDNGYRWWYVDAISDDGRHALTCIAFVGSVFSPYYAWSRRRQPYSPAIDFCAVNLALYGSPSRWCMSERDRVSVKRSADQLHVGASYLQRAPGGEGQQLHISVNERAMPLPQAVKGRLTLDLPDWTIEPQAIDREALHWWQPIAPHTRITVSLSSPGLSWTGNAYVDSNAGCLPLESSFSHWEWSRMHRPDGATDVQYDVVERDGQRPERNFCISHTGSLTESPPASKQARRSLPKTRWWRIPRTVRLMEGARVNALETLEDTPFYARSRFRCETDLGITECVQESLLLDRFDHPVTRCLLPFRMPRLTGRFAHHPDVPGRSHAP